MDRSERDQLLGGCAGLVLGAALIIILKLVGVLP
jgi:hypothetical protein